MPTYEKTIWHTGDVITLENMQKIENQLELVTPGATGALRYDQSQELSASEQECVKQNLGLQTSAAYSGYPIITADSNTFVLKNAVVGAPIYNLQLYLPLPTPSSTPTPQAPYLADIPSSIQIAFTSIDGEETYTTYDIPLTFQDISFFGYLTVTEGSKENIKPLFVSIPSTLIHWTSYNSSAKFFTGQGVPAGSANTSKGFSTFYKQVPYTSITDQAGNNFSFGIANQTIYLRDQQVTSVNNLTQYLNYNHVRFNYELVRRPDINITIPEIVVPKARCKVTCSYGTIMDVKYYQNAMMNIPPDISFALPTTSVSGTNVVKVTGAVNNVQAKTLTLTRNGLVYTDSGTPTPTAPIQFVGAKQIKITKIKEHTKLVDAKELFPTKDGFIWSGNIVTGTSALFKAHPYTIPAIFRNEYISVSAVSDSNCRGRYTTSQSETPYYINKYYNTSSILGSFSPDSVNTQFWFESASDNDEEILAIKDIGITWGQVGTVLEPEITTVDLPETFYCGQLDLTDGTMQQVKTSSTMGITINTNYAFVSSDALVIDSFDLTTNQITCIFPEKVVAHSIVSPNESASTHYYYRASSAGLLEGTYTIQNVGASNVRLAIQDSRFTSREAAETILQDTNDLMTFAIPVNTPILRSFNQLIYPLSGDPQFIMLNLDGTINLTYYISINSKLNQLEQMINSLSS